MLHVCYDLATNPPTYDVCTFLGFAELARIEFEFSNIKVHILPGPYFGFRKDSLWPYTTEERNELLKNIVVPMFDLLPSVFKVEIHKTRLKEHSNFYGHMNRLISLPNFIKLMEAGIRPLRFPVTQTQIENLVTITLREADHHPLRNSNVAEWIKAAHILEKMGYIVIVIRDTLKSDQVIDGLQISMSASKNLLARASFYSRAVMNLGINNGPMWMAIMMNAPVLMLKPTTNILGGCYDDNFFKHCGLSPGAQLPTSPPYQHIAWLEDTCENIINSFNKVMTQCRNG